MKKFSKVTFGSDNGLKAAQRRIWLPGTQQDIISQLKSKGFQVMTSRPCRAEDKPAKEPKAKKAKAAKKAARKETAAAAA